MIYFLEALECRKNESLILALSETLILFAVSLSGQVSYMHFLIKDRFGNTFRSTFVYLKSENLFKSLHFTNMCLKRVSVRWGGEHLNTRHSLQRGWWEELQNSERRRTERNIKSYRYYKLSKPCVGSNWL